MISEEEAAKILAVQDAMVADMTPEQRERYEAFLNPHASWYAQCTMRDGVVVSVR